MNHKTNARQWHVYKAKSRLGLIHNPINAKDNNAGVENGPDYILSTELVKKAKFSALDTFTFTLPETISEERYFETIAQESIALAALINSTIRDTESQLVVGGDHSVTLASLLALTKRKDLNEVGYIQFDSHADLNLVKSSPTGNFHGMYLRPFLGNFDNEIIQSLVDTQLLPINILYVGNLDLDDEEKEFIAKKEIVHISGKQITSHEHEIISFIQNHQHIHVSFDIDMFDQSVAPATGIPCRDGIFFKDILPLLEALSQVNSISVDLVEVNPNKDIDGMTLRLAQKVLLTII